MLRRARLANALCMYFSISIGCCCRNITMTNNPSTDDCFPQHDGEVSVYRSTIMFTNPSRWALSIGSRVPVSLRVEGDVRKYVDCELHK